MPFADLNGSESSCCADSTGVSAGHIGKTALLLRKHRHDRQTRRLFFTFIMNSKKYGHPYLTSKRLIRKFLSVRKPIVKT
ncbi:hypothetical protein [Alkalicoccus luteus]|uniref:hypothetical protein n=1 Tax=Alkalicoccus luteus TaxID=1237094 RepID=UPI001439A9F2|nr:hypothetical protein [Alkalicoccus luteus]